MDAQPRQLQVHSDLDHFQTDAYGVHAGKLGDIGREVGDSPRSSSRAGGHGKLHTIYHDRDFKAHSCRRGLWNSQRQLRADERRAAQINLLNNLSKIAGLEIVEVSGQVIAEHEDVFLGIAQRNAPLAGSQSAVERGQIHGSLNLTSELDMVEVSSSCDVLDRERKTSSARS